MPAAYLDESEQGRFLGVGGFYARATDLTQIEAAWRRMKVNDLGLDANDESKWNLPTNHPTRVKIDAAGKGGQLRNEAMIAALTSLPVTLVCVVMRENRLPIWEQIIGRRSVRDFYCEGLTYTLQRLGDEAQRAGASEPWVCTVDRPDALTKIPLHWPSTRWLNHGMKAANELYRHMMQEGPGQGPRGRVPPLRELGFVSGLFTGHASHDDLLQIADCVVGAVTSIVKDTSEGGASPWLVERVKSMVPRFRGDAAGMFGNGFVLWPKDERLWKALMANLL